jgi:hypothetical protein
MSRLCSTRFTFAALTLAAGMHATNPAFAQNINDLLTIFGGDRQRGARHAQTEWRRLPPAEMSCIDHRLRSKGSSVEALIRGGVKPSAARLVELRSSCREFVHRSQTGSAPALARDATAAIAARSPTEPKDVNVTSSAESPKDSGVVATAEPSKDVDVALSREPSKESDVTRLAEAAKDSDVTPPAEASKDSDVTPPAESSKDSDVTPPAELSAEPSKESDPVSLAETSRESSSMLQSEQSLVKAAEEQIQQGDPGPKNSGPERGMWVSQSAAFLFAVAAITLLVVIVIYLFKKWRNTVQSTAAGHT